MLVKYKLCYNSSSVFSCDRRLLPTGTRNRYACARAEARDGAAEQARDRHLRGQPPYVRRVQRRRGLRLGYALLTELELVPYFNEHTYYVAVHSVEYRNIV